MRKAPPLPFLPEEWHGKEVLVLAMCYAGDPAKAESGDALPYAASASRSPTSSGRSLSPAGKPPSIRCLTPGARNYWKSHDFNGLSDEAIAVSSPASGRCRGRNARSSSAMSAVR